MTIVHTVVLGAIGGLLPDVLRLIKERDHLQAYLGSGGFYLSLVLLAGVGALAAYIAPAGSVKEAVAIGFAAPEFLSRLGSNTGQPAERGPVTSSVRGSGFRWLRAWWTA